MISETFTLGIIDPLTCDKNCENTSGCVPAAAAGADVADDDVVDAGVGVDAAGLVAAVVVVEVVVDAPLLLAAAADAAAAVKPGGSEGRPIELKTSGAAVRKRSIPLWMSMIACSASGFDISCWTLGFWIKKKD